MKLTQRDYLIILDYYNIAPPKSKRGNLDSKKIKESAEFMLATKLCKCSKV